MITYAGIKPTLSDGTIKKPCSLMLSKLKHCCFRCNWVRQKL